MEGYENALNSGGYSVLDSAVYKFSGDVVKFLDPLTSNTIATGKNAFLDSFGKLVVLFDQLIEGDNVYIVFGRQFQFRLKEHLKGFLRLGKTRMEKTDLKVAHVLPTRSNDTDNIKKLYRMTINQRVGFLVLSYNLDFLKPLREMPEDFYSAMRIENNIPVQGIDFDQDMLLNIGWPEAVSFTKGCFVGQEIVGRVHNLGKPPKKLVRVAFDNVPEKVTSNGETIGNPTSVCYSPKYKKHIAFSIIPSKIEKIDNGEIIE